MVPFDSLVAAGAAAGPAAGAAFAAGVLTSIGPCAAPRFIAVAAFAGQRRGMLRIAAFVVGLAGAYLAVGFAAGLLGTLTALSGVLYAVLAVGLVSAGCVALVRAESDGSESHACAHADTHEPPRSLGAALLLGAGSALVVSPCCTPAIGAIAATSAALGKPLTGAFLLLSFALGHALPLVGAGSIAPALRKLLPRAVPAQAPAIVSAVLTIALGLYYGVLA
jgi:cytochrome c biogenesis protein CcdA